MISIEELKRLIEKERAQLYRMELAEDYDLNILSEGKYYRYINNETYDPWYTFIKVLTIKRESARYARVISFEKTINDECIYSGEYKRRINLLGEEISQEEFIDEFSKFNVTVRHFAISVKL